MDRLDQLERLAGLKRKGVLNDDEFTAEKARVLAMPLPAIGSSEPKRSARLIIAGSTVALLTAVSGAIWIGKNDVVPTVQPPAVAIVHRLPTAAPVPPPVPTVKPISLATAQREAFAAAFGYQPPRDLTEGERGIDAADDGLFRPVALIPVGFHQAVVAVHEAPSVHVNGGVLVVRYVDLTAAGFRRLGMSEARIETGSFGQIGGWKVRRDIGSVPMIAVEGGGTWQGCSATWTSLIELAAAAPRVLVDGIPTELDDQSGTDQGPRFDGTLVRSGAGITVRYTGSDQRTIRFARRVASSFRTRNCRPAVEANWCRAGEQAAVPFVLKSVYAH